MLVYLIAGEPSGDTLGAKLMRALKKADPKIEFAGLGGENMQKEGLNSLFDITDLAIMGLAEVIPSIPKVLKRLKQTVADIKAKQPAAVITIDSWSFSSRVHKALRKDKIDTLQIHYVAPQVWAWKKGRAKTMYKYIDHLLTLFPNEPAYFTPYRLTADCVGHPAIEDIKQTETKTKENNLILLLPGSRHNEVTRLLPVFLQTAALLKQQNPALEFALPTVKTVETSVRQILKASQMKDIKIINDPLAKKQAFADAHAAIAASGTVSLELALLKIPHIIAYKVAPLTAFIARHFLKIWSVNLPNIILNERVIKEMLQESCTPAALAEAITPYLDNKGKARENFLQKMTELHQKLGVGKETPSQKAASIILNKIKERHQK
ncbi:MAG: lipid-A-disaccharide synthase [Alphaproteobacteria bacterium]|nr:lipid-A-disaccharide synthase [Alphaproteobacteria bacterium]